MAVWIFGEFSEYLWKQGFVLQQLLGYKFIFVKILTVIKFHSLINAKGLMLGHFDILDILFSNS